MSNTKRLIIHGKVQGVGYRYNMIAAAKRIGVMGWVRNRRNGTVEAVVQGAPSALEEITTWANHGPSNAKVKQVEILEEETTETYFDFTQHPTA